MNASSLQLAAGLPPWIKRQAIALLQQRGHAWLLQGPSGLGQRALGLALVQAWLCEQPQADGLACGKCPGCHGVGSHTHADLHVLAGLGDCTHIGADLFDGGSHGIQVAADFFA